MATSCTSRGYILVDPDPVADTVDIEFALHDGLASRLPEQAQPGDTIEVTLLGTNFALPEPRPAGYVIVGDTASLPAVNTLLNAIGDAPGPGVPGGRARRRQRAAGCPRRRDHPGRPQERR
jgi:NADPH-dependent ferric siderophore reductase